jgi:hypothetical protein
LRKCWLIWRYDCRQLLNTNDGGNAATLDTFYCNYRLYFLYCSFCFADEKIGNGFPAAFYQYYFNFFNGDTNVFLPHLFAGAVYTFGVFTGNSGITVYGRNTQKATTKKYCRKRRSRKMERHCINYYCAFCLFSIPSKLKALERVTLFSSSICSIKK